MGAAGSDREQGDDTLGRAHDAQYHGACYVVLMRGLLASLTLVAACGSGTSVPLSAPDGGAPDADGGDSIDTSVGLPGDADHVRPADADAPPTGPTDVKAELISAYCAAKMSCCTQAQVPLDPARCRENLDARPGFSAGAAQACLAELRSSVARPSAWCQIMDSADLHVCAQVFGWTPGNKAVGEPCTKAQECAPSAEGRVVCRGDLSDQNARCAVVVRGKVGDGPCEPYYRQGTPSRFFACDFFEDLYCDSNTDTCQRTLPLGTACRSIGAWCSRDGVCDTTERMCVARLPEGTPCCEGGCMNRCVLGTHCDRQTMRCAPLRPLGAPCSLIECASGLCTDGKCAPQDSDPTKICAQLAGG
jgi:hypothetical protein